MKNDKKVKLFWGVKESEIDENLLKKILKYQKKFDSHGNIFAVCCA